MSNGNRRILRLAATGILAAGSLTLLSAPAYAARSVEDACPTGAAAEDDFTDTGAEGSEIESAVDCLVDYGVSSGFPDDTYRPSQNVSRAQMATFIMQKLDLVEGFEREDDADDAFTDDDGNTHEQNIDDAAAAGIVGGVTGDVNDDGQTPDYNPSGDVTRAQMATFIVNQLEAAGVDLPADAPDAFTDDDGDTHEENINILAALDIVDGLVGDVNDDGEEPDYGPNNPVTRGQMAFFLTRDLDLLVEEGLVEPLDDGTNQDITVATQDLVFLSDNNTATDATDTGDDRSFTATGLEPGLLYRITLIDTLDITNEDGTISFADTNSDNLADPAGAPNAAEISVVNGVVQPNNTYSVGGIPAINGQITFSIDASDEFSVGSVQPVVFVDSGANTQLELNAADEPIEAFGLGGITVVLPPEAAAGNSTTTVGININLLNVFTNLPPTQAFFYDSNDTFQFAGVNVTLDQFKSAIDNEDVIGITYNPDPAGVSVFNLVTDDPADVPAVTATVVNGDAEAVVNDIRVTFTPPEAFGLSTNSEGTTLTLQRSVISDTNANGVCDPAPADTPGPFVAVAGATPVENPDGTMTFRLEDQSNGCYQFRLVAQQPISGTVTTGAPSAIVQVPGTADTTAPEAEDTELFAVGGFPETIDVGDVIKVCLDEVLAPLSDADVEAIQISDTDATASVAELRSGVNATFALNAAASNDTNNAVAPATSCPAGAELTITVTAAPTVITAGTVPGVQVATAVISNAADIEDQVGNLWAPAGDPDVTINVEPGAEPT